MVATFAGGGWGYTGVAGSGNADGTSAGFYSPVGVAVADNGMVYVADAGNSLIRTITLEGTVSTFAGHPLTGSSNGVGTNAKFFGPHGVAIAPNGVVYVSDRGNNLLRAIATPVPCPVNTSNPHPVFTAADVATLCAPCPANSFAPANARACLCLAGFVPTSAAPACTPCAAGFTIAAASPLGAVCEPAPAPATLTCAAPAAQAVPAALGLVLLPAATPGNARGVDVIAMPAGACAGAPAALACATGGAALTVTVGGVAYAVVDDAAALNMEAAESLTCTA